MVTQRTNAQKAVRAGAIVAYVAFWIGVLLAHSLFFTERGIQAFWWLALGFTALLLCSLWLTRQR